VIAVYFVSVNIKKHPLRFNDDASSGCNLCDHHIL
jgi:hypothetical protein